MDDVKEEEVVVVGVVKEVVVGLEMGKMGDGTKADIPVPVVSIIICAIVFILTIRSLSLSLSPFNCISVSNVL